MSVLTRPLPAWAILVGAAIGCAAGIGIGTLTSTSGEPSASSPTGSVSASPAATTPPPALANAASNCMLDAAVVRDAGATLILDGEGKDDRKYKDGEWTVAPGKIDTDDVSCVLRELHAPQSLAEKMNGTRALDGRQEDSWGDYEVSWSYHPDDGLDLIITVRQE